MEETKLTTPKDPLEVYIPDDACYQWGLEQNVTAYLNIENYSLIPLAVSITCILLYELCIEHETMKDYAHFFVEYAKYGLYIFFFIYFVIIKMRLYYFVMG